MARTMVGWFLLALAASSGCGSDLPPASRVDKLRVLAVRVEPPEVRPGQLAILDALAVTPPTELGMSPPSISYLWLACIQQSGGASPTACGVTTTGNGGPGAFGDGPTSLTTCADAPDAPLCLLGIQPSVTYAPPELPGGEGQVIVTVIVADADADGALGCAMAAAANGGAPVKPDHCVIALKRLTVSASEAPNRNPTLDALTLGGASLLDGQVHFKLPAEGDKNDPIALSVVRTPGSAEVKADGTYEPLTLSWFTTAGALSDGRSSLQKADCDTTCQMMDVAPAAATRWTAPLPVDAAKYVHGNAIDFWAVLRDDRGGVGWLGGSLIIDP